MTAKRELFDASADVAEVGTTGGETLELLEPGTVFSTSIQPQALENVLVLTRRMARAMPNVSRFCCAASMPIRSASRKVSASDLLSHSATAAIAC